MAVELRKNGIKFAQQVGVAVHYDGVNVGDYTADLLVEDAVLVELKAVRALDGRVRISVCEAGSVAPTIG
jgi:GxxExxY protein